MDATARFKIGDKVSFISDFSKHIYGSIVDVGMVGSPKKFVFIYKIEDETGRIHKCYEENLQDES